MSDSTGPVRRRRIAGENKPAAPVSKSAGKKAPAKKAAAKRAPAKKTTAARKAPATKTAAPAPVAQETKPRTVPIAKVARPPRPASRSTDAPPPPPGASTRRRDLRWLVPAVLVTVVALVAGVWLAVAGVKHIRGDEGGSGLETSQKQATAAAGTAAETIFSFRYDQLDQHLSASKALMTSSFSKDFDKIAPALTELAPQRKIVVKAVTRDAAVLACGDECSATKANVLVFVDQARLVGGSKEPTVFANRISVSMVKTDEGWLVNNIRAL